VGREAVYIVPEKSEIGINTYGIFKEGITFGKSAEKKVNNIMENRKKLGQGGVIIIP